MLGYRQQIQMQNKFNINNTNISKIELNGLD
jgi:hypothetical protein